jgi:hypothetical protein
MSATRQACAQRAFQRTMYGAGAVRIKSHGANTDMETGISWQSFPTRQGGNHTARILPGDCPPESFGKILKKPIFKRVS